jgi:hypothetical protein
VAGCIIGSRGALGEWKPVIRDAYDDDMIIGKLLSFITYTLHQILSG